MLTSKNCFYGAELRVLKFCFWSFELSVLRLFSLLANECPTFNAFGTFEGQHHQQALFGSCDDHFWFRLLTNERRNSL